MENWDNLYDFLEQFESWEEREKVLEAIRIYKIHEQSWEDIDLESWEEWEE